jgi:protein-disulfide isomerase
MSSSKNMNARERARLAAEQAAARKRDQRILIAVIAGFVLVVVAAGIGFQAWRTNRSPSTAPSTAVSASPVTISNGRPIVLGSSQAPATITLYEDFHCPHCGVDGRRLTLACLQSLPAGCPVCRAALPCVLTERRDARRDPP